MLGSTRQPSLMRTEQKRPHHLVAQYEKCMWSPGVGWLGIHNRRTLQMPLPGTMVVLF
jgi:hypothetical protein